MTPSKEFDRPITDSDLSVRLAEVVEEATAKKGAAPTRASASIVGNKIRCTVDFRTRSSSL